MDDSLLHQGEKSLTKLREDVHTVHFWEMLACFNEAGQIPIAQFLNDVVIFGTFHDVDKAHDVLVEDDLHNFDLVLEGGLEVLVLINYRN